jgi:NAD(P)-dependent dehydrogenase (short-subunit alcohol dehydrogenase family)
MGRPADPAELAAAALWLCSSGASYVTGHAMIVDGGVTAGETSTRFDDLMD